MFKFRRKAIALTLAVSVCFNSGTIVNATEDVSVTEESTVEETTIPAETEEETSTPEEETTEPTVEETTEPIVEETTESTVEEETTEEEITLPENDIILLGADTEIILHDGMVYDSTHTTTTCGTVMSDKVLTSVDEFDADNAPSAWQTEHVWHEFQGWYNNADFTGVPVTSVALGDELWAKWSHSSTVTNDYGIASGSHCERWYKWNEFNYDKFTEQQIVEYEKISDTEPFGTLNQNVSEYNFPLSNIAREAETLYFADDITVVPSGACMYFEQLKTVNWNNIEVLQAGAFARSFYRTDRYCIYTDKESDLVVLDLSNTKITEIGDAAFYGAEFDKIILPKKLKAIGAGAFGSIERLTEFPVLPETLESIGADAFVGDGNWNGTNCKCKKCNREKAHYNTEYAAAHHGDVVIPKNVKSIGTNAFNECMLLSSFKVSSENKVLTLIPEDAFYQTDTLDTLDLRNSAVEEIGKDAFYYSKVKNIYLGDACKKVNDDAFNYCGSIKKLDTGANLEYIGDNCFSGIGGGYFSQDTKVEITFGENLKHVGDYAFYSSGKIATTGDVHFSKDLTYIGTYAFSRLTTPNDTDKYAVYIPKLEALQSGSFAYCFNLNEIYGNFKTTTATTSELEQMFIAGAIYTETYDITTGQKYTNRKIIDAFNTSAVKRYGIYIDFVDDLQTNNNWSLSTPYRDNFTYDSATQSYKISNSFTLKGTTGLSDILDSYSMSTLDVDDDFDCIQYYNDITSQWEEATDDILTETLTADNAYVTAQDRTIHLRAHYNIPEYTVTFKNGDDIYKTITVLKGEKIAQPTEPTTEGKTFVGWFMDKECTITYDFNTTIDKNTTIYAGWKDITCTVEFKDIDSTLLKTVTLTYGSKVANPAVSSTGKSIVGWYKDTKLENPWNLEQDVVKTDTVLYAEWENWTATVVFKNASDHNYITIGTLKEVPYGNRMSIDTSSTNYIKNLTFYKDSDCKNTWDLATDQVKGSKQDDTVYIYYKYDLKEYTVTIYDNYYGTDGKLEKTDTRNTLSLAYDTEYKYSALTPSGYNVISALTQTGRVTENAVINFAYQKKATSSNTDSKDQSNSDSSNNNSSSSNSTVIKHKVTIIDKFTIATPDTVDTPADGTVTQVVGGQNIVWSIYRDNGIVYMTRQQVRCIDTYNNGASYTYSAVVPDGFVVIGEDKCAGSATVDKEFTFNYLASTTVQNVPKQVIDTPVINSWQPEPKTGYK